MYDKPTQIKNFTHNQLFLIHHTTKSTYIIERQSGGTLTLTLSPHDITTLKHLTQPIINNWRMFKIHDMSPPKTPHITGEIC